MDFFTATESRQICAALTAIVLLLVFAEPRARFKTAILGLVIALGIANAFTVIHKRLVHSNLTHYYLGAKYGMSYFDFYKVMAAARGDPQVMYRDLREPDRMFRSDPREQRLYYVDLLRQAAVPFRQNSTLAQLADACRSGGLVDKEAAAILEQSGMTDRAGKLRDDLSRLKLDVDDFGFNGSPLYALIRQLDPTLHRPFGPGVCLLNMAWQWAALFLIALLAARIFGWTRDETLLALALFLSAWNYTGWALNGLTTAGWILPVMLALWGFHRRNPWLAGFGIAWAGLIKLFPFVLVLPLAVIVARQVLARQLTPTGKEAAKALAACAVSAAALAGISTLQGRSWTEFFEKISIQFQNSSYLNNSVGVSNIFLTLGMPQSLSIVLPQATVFFAIAWILWMMKEEDLRDRLPGISLVLLASLAWLTRTWFNYYAIVAFLLIPGLLRKNRNAALLMLALFTIGGLLPEFGFTYREPFTFLPIVKILGYLVLPLAAIAMEIKDIRQSQEFAPESDPISRWFFKREQVILLIGTALSVVFICAEIYRANTARMNLTAGREMYAKGAVRDARQFFENAVRHAPRDAAARIELAQTMVDMRDFEDALAQYEEAVKLNPKFAPTRSRLGVLFVQTGRKDEAIAQFEEAARLMPYEETIQHNLGSALLSVGKKDEAAKCFQTALDANPDFAPARKQLERIRSM